MNKTYSVQPSWRKRNIRVQASNAYEAMRVCEMMAFYRPEAAGLSPFALFMTNAAQQDISPSCRRYTHRDGRFHVDVVEVA